MGSRDPEFDYYELSSVLGEGGMGVVYKARDRRTGLPVAIKVMSKRLHDPELQFRFVRENEILSSLNHRNIVRCYDVTRARDGTPSLVMEFVDGVDFRSFEGFPYPELLPLMVQTLLGMRYLRGQNIVHRDLSSNNILVCLEGDSRLVKIVDFGIAKILYATPTDGDILTQTGQFLGKFSFASPELLLGAPFDWKSDVYSLGVIFYRLLTGQFPVRVERSGNYFEWVMAHQKPHAFDFAVPEGCPALPAELVEAVRSMLSKEPDDRPSSWEEIISTFDAVQRGVFAQGLAPEPEQVRQLPPKRAETYSSRPGGFGTPAGSPPGNVAAAAHLPFSPVRVSPTPPPAPHTPSQAARGPRLPSDDIPTARSEGAPRSRSGRTPVHAPSPATPHGPAPTPPIGLRLPPSLSGVVHADAPSSPAPADLPVESGSLTEMVDKPSLAAEEAPGPVSGDADVPLAPRAAVKTPPPQRDATPSGRMLAVGPPGEAPVRAERTPPKREITPVKREPTPGRLPEIPGRVALTPPRRETLPLQEAFRPAAPVPPAPAPKPPAEVPASRSGGPVVRPRPQAASRTVAGGPRRGSVPVVVQGKRPGWVKITLLVVAILAVFAIILFVLLSLLGSTVPAGEEAHGTNTPAAAPAADRTKVLEGRA